MKARFQIIDTLAVENPLVKAWGIGAAKQVKISQSEVLRQHRISTYSMAECKEMLDSVHW